MGQHPGMSEQAGRVLWRGQVPLAKGRTRERGEEGLLSLLEPRNSTLSSNTAIIFSPTDLPVP